MWPPHGPSKRMNPLEFFFGDGLAGCCCGKQRPLVFIGRDRFNVVRQALQNGHTTIERCAGTRPTSWSTLRRSITE